MAENCSNLVVTWTFHIHEMRTWALNQLFLLIFGSRPVVLSNWFFLVPTALIAAAVYIFLRKPDSAGEVADMTFIGISFAVFGICTMVEGALIGRSNRARLRNDGQPALDKATESAGAEVETGPDKPSEA